MWSQSPSGGVVSKAYLTTVDAPMPNSVASPLEFMDLPLERGNPVVWAVNEYASPTGRHFDIHVGLEVGIVLTGRSRRLYREHERIIEPGQFWLVAPWETHGVQILKPQTRHLVLGILPEYLGTSNAYTGCDWMELFRTSPAERPQTASAMERQNAKRFAGRFIAALESNGPHRLARLRILLQEFLLDIMERAPASAGGLPVSAPPDEADLLTALRLVERDPSRKITLASAAHVAGMSRTRFAAQFHAFTGLTFARYLVRRRVRGAIGDLRGGGGRKLEVIAQRWGFADASHMIRLFRQQTGYTPEVYRRLNRGNSDDDGRAPHIGAMPRPNIFM